MLRHPVALACMLVVTAMVCASAVLASVSGVVAGGIAPGAGTTALVPIEPCRLLDSRVDGEPLTAGAVVEVQVAGRCSVPVDAAAASLTLTSVAPGASGWLSAHPSDVAWPGTSTLNVAAGEVRANTSIVGLGSGGAVSVLVDAGGHLLVDVTSAFVPADTAEAGRFVGVPQQRLIDTRGATRPDPGATVVVPLPAGVPSDATALTINLTTVDSTGPGYFTVTAGSELQPSTSILNTDAAGQTRAASAVVPVSASGLEVYTSAGDHVVVDVSGYFTGASAETSAEGLFRPIAPVRVADTRADGERLFRSGTREWVTDPVTGGSASAVVANVTMTGVGADGWVLAYPSRTDRPFASSVNASAGETVANLAVTPVSTAGLAVHAAAGSDVVLDLVGWFVGEPVAATGSIPTNVRQGPGRTLIIGDSIPAALNHVPSALDRLATLDQVFDAIECRRTAAPSCVFRGRIPPPSAVDTLVATPGPFETLVMVTGYNDPNSTFASAIDQLVTTSRSLGIAEVVWVTVREDRENLVRNNQHLVAALDRHPELRLLDWGAHAAGQRSWFAADNVHLSRDGADALARFIVDGLIETG